MPKGSALVFPPGEFGEEAVSIDNHFLLRLLCAALKAKDEVSLFGIIIRCAKNVQFMVI